MKRNPQAGATTIELLIAMAVAGSVIGALVGVVYAANGAVQRWQQPLSTAATRPMEEILAGSVETDAQVFVPCQVTAAEIDFGDPRCQAPYAVVYTLRGNDIARTAGGSTVLLTHRLGAQPTFSRTCSSQDAINLGTIRISNLNYGGALPDVTVGFTAPRGPC